MSKHTLRKPSHKGIPRDRFSRSGIGMGKIVQAGGTGSIARKMKGNHSMNAGILSDIFTRKIKIFRNRLLPFLRSRPVLAEQSALVRHLGRMAATETHSVAGRK